MSFLLNLLSNQYFEDEFYAVIDRLKSQHTLPDHSFVKTLPFFSFSTVSKESQIKELFLSTCNLNLYRDLLSHIASLRGNIEPEALSRQLSKLHVMNFAQLVLYKVLPCPESECTRCPREIVTHNQYRDFEYECPFYHHDRDRRRMVITANLEEEFVYKANYYEEGRRHGEKEKYSQNYFESMFHPLYYKMFKCKREYCNLSNLCPFFHSEEEKRIWSTLFSEFVRKDRVAYVRDKQKYYENNSHAGLEGPNKGTHYEVAHDKSRQKNMNIRNRKNTNNHLGNSGNKPKASLSKKAEQWKEEGNSEVLSGSNETFWSFFGKNDKEFIGQEVC